MKRITRIVFLLVLTLPILFPSATIFAAAEPTDEMINSVNLETASGMVAAENLNSKKSLERKEDYAPSTISTLDNSGDKGMDAPEALAINEDTNASVAVAVIDDGVEYDHPDLPANMWNETNCKDENGVAIAGGCENGNDNQGNNSTPIPAELLSEATVIAVEKPAAEEKNNYVSGEILVKYRKNSINLETASGMVAAANLTNEKSLEKKEDLEESNISVLEITDAKTVEQKVTELQNDPNVEYAQPNFQYVPSTISTNDTNKDILWGLDNFGQTVNGTWGNITGTNDKDMDAPEAWVINEGTNASVIVAVIDDGVAYDHPDLAANMWNGANCKDENGVAIAGGCVNGYDYQSNDNTPMPAGLSHGTHIAGTIAAEKNNNAGVIGVAPNAKIMALKTNYTTSQIIKSISFAAQNGARVINASWGSVDPMADNLLKNAIASFPGLFIAAAGNCGDSNYALNGCTYQNQAFYPASFDLPNIITVAATDQNDALASFSNNDPVSVDVGAPGTNIYSTYYNGQYGYKNGTSMAAPHVAGLVALIEGYNPGLSDAQVKNIILTTGDSVAALSGKTVSGKRINAQNALQGINPAKAITAFSLASPAAIGVVNENAKTIAITVPLGTNVTALVPTITITGASVSPASGSAQNFTNSVTYTVTAADSSTQAYTVTVTSAQAATFTISGSIKYYDGVKAVPNAAVILENSGGTQIATTTTSATGTYQFTEVAGGSNYVVRVSKSDNANGLTAADQIKIGRHIVGLEPFSTIYKTIAGDVNNSGNLTAGDQIKIGRFIVGLDANLTSGAWKFYSSDASLTTSNYLTVGLARTYTNLSADMANQNFVGVKKGDVNNSWTGN